VSEGLAIAADVARAAAPRRGLLVPTAGALALATAVLALAVLDVFAQTWLSRMRERTQAVAVALAQRAQVQLYWQHDMRNLAQWVGLLAEEFGAATPDQLPRLAQRLQRQAPLLQARAHKLLAATEAPTQVPAEDEPPVQALDLLHNAAELAGLAIAIDIGHHVAGEVAVVNQAILAAVLVLEADHGTPHRRALPDPADVGVGDDARLAAQVVLPRQLERVAGEAVGRPQLPRRSGGRA